jgi:hypothetical protein
MLSLCCSLKLTEQAVLDSLKRREDLVALQHDAFNQADEAR